MDTVYNTPLIGNVDISSGENDMKILRPGPYGKGHATFDIPISNKKEDADDGKWEYNLKRSEFDSFKWIKENVKGYSGISLGRSGMEGFSSLFDVEKEIGKGISSAKNIINGIRQGVDGEKSVNLPQNMRMLFHNRMIDYREYGVYKCASPWVNRIVNADVVYAGILPPQMSIAVPLRTLLAGDGNGSYIKGLMVAGKAISCTHNAFPGMRMQPDLQHQGAVIGLLDNNCASVAISACMKLQRLTGSKTGTDIGKWHRKVNSGEFSPAVCPISLKNW